MKLFTKIKYSKTMVIGLSLLVMLSFLIQGCGTDPQSDSANATLSAMRQAIAGTTTAEAVDAANAGDLATAEAVATQQSQDISATQTAQVADRDETQLATATVAAPVIAELPTYGLDASSGRVGWIHDPLTLEVSGYQQMTFGNDYMNVTAKDFVLAADVTWDTQYGDSGCGFLFRSNGDQQKPDGYMLIASRFANGRVVFTALADGEPANMRHFYPRDADRSFEWQNGTTNRIAIVARDNLIEVYTNRLKIGEIDTTQPPKQPILPPRPEPPVDQLDQNAKKIYEDQLEQYEDIVQQSQTNFQVAKTNFEAGKSIFTDGFLSM
ncbi:MAG TPA: hypothetical protein VMW34_09015, partial [Anaerolineales bacterium]|nr:hypothetical protein [Anaerolineales bacterium]